MSVSTGIEWTDATWNPVTGCTRVSPGCAHCYIERTPPFRMEGRRFTHGADGATTGVRLHPERLEQPLRWRKPRRVFVNSLSDLFHEDVPSEYIASVLDTIVKSPQHVFQVLTKRPERMRDAMVAYYDAIYWGYPRFGDDWQPLHNLWLGVSIENARYTHRADVLREIPAAVRFISAEPLLGSLFPPGSSPADADGAEHALDHHESVGERQGRQPGGKAPLDLTGIDWVIVGGESGPGARPMHPDWARELRDATRCIECHGSCSWTGWSGDDEHTQEGGCVRCEGTGAETAFFFKQWGEWAPESLDPAYDYVRQSPARGIVDLGSAQMARIGKKRAGRLLDGRTWDEFPDSRAPKSPGNHRKETGSCSPPAA